MDSFAARSHRYSLERRMLHVARGIGVASSKQNHAVTRSFRRRSFSYIHGHHAYLSLLASRSDSSKQRMSSSRTVHVLVSTPAIVGISLLLFGIPGPLTLRIMLRVVSSMNSTRTWVTPPREPIACQTCPYPPNFFSLYRMQCIPVRPRTRVTLTSLTGTLDIH